MSELPPQLFVLTQSGKYLRHTNGYVDISETHVFDPMCKIAAEPAKSDRRYVHLRFVHTNKYWAREERGSNFIATSNKPVEDASKPSCTLFTLLPPDNKGRFSFHHIQTFRVLSAPSPSEGTSHVNLFHQGQSEDQTKFIYIDWDTLIVMPRYLAFKGDNNRYLRATWIHRFRYLQFSAEDPSHTDAGFEVTSTRDGHVRIKSLSFGLFWRRSPNWIWADSNDSFGNDKDTLFWPVKVSSNVVALRNAGNGAFCFRLSTEGKRDCLNANVYNISKEAKLKLEELVLEQEVFDVRYRMEDAHIYEETPVVLGAQDSENHTNKVNSSQTITVKFEEEKTYNFTNSLSITLGVKAKIKAGFPFITEGKIEVSAAVSTSFEWNHGEAKRTGVKASYTTDVPPRSRLVVKYAGTQGKCDVPFSYRMKQRLARDGRVVITDHNDGIYVGLNSYNFHFLQPKVQPLP